MHDVHTPRGQPAIYQFARAARNVPPADNADRKKIERKSETNAGHIPCRNWLLNTEMNERSELTLKADLEERLRIPDAAMGTYNHFPEKRW